MSTPISRARLLRSVLIFNRFGQQDIGPISHIGPIRDISPISHIGPISTGRHKSIDHLPIAAPEGVRANFGHPGSGNPRGNGRPGFLDGAGPPVK